MSDKMKVRDGNDGYSYPYTSPDLVIDKDGKSSTTKFNELDSQFKDIANKTNFYIKADNMPNNFINFVPNDKSKASNNSQALQYYFDNIQKLDNQTLIFGQGNYYFDSPVIKRCEHLIKIKGNSNGKNGAGLTCLYYTGDDVFISLGEDDGEPENSNLYNGVGNLWLEDIMLSGKNDGTLENGVNYGIGQYGIKDYRGGSLQFKNVTIQQFEYGLYLIESDYNSYYDLCLRANKNGIYVGARSDQQTFHSLNTYNNNVSVKINGAIDVNFINPYFVANISKSSQIIINNNLRETRVSLNNGWYEMHAVDGVTEFANSFINIGEESDINNTLIVNITEPAIQNSKIPHFLSINTKCQVTLNNVSTNGFYDLFDFTWNSSTANTNNDYCIVNLNNSPTHQGLKRFTITGRKDLLRLTGNSNSYGVQQIAMGAQNRLDFLTPTTNNSLLEMFLDYGSTGLRFNHSSFNGGKYLQFEKRIFYSNTIPTETNINFTKGDICFNKVPTAGSYVGWVCIEAGSPGTWKGFGMIES